MAKRSKKQTQSTKPAAVSHTKGLSPEAAVLYERGQQLVKAARWEEAADALGQAAALAPDYAPLHFELGVCWYQLRQYERARQAYETALRLNPKDARLLNNLGVLYIRLGDLPQAVTRLEAALKLAPREKEIRKNLESARAARADPKRAAAQRLLGQEDLQAGQAGQAVEHLEAAARGGLADVETLDLLEQAYTAVGKPERTAAFCQELLEGGANSDAARLRLGRPVERPKALAEELVHSGRQLMQSGQFGPAAARLQQAANLAELPAETYNDLGACYFKTGDYFSAQRFYERALQADANLSATYNNLGALYAQLGNFEQAVRNLEQALRLDPRDADARQNLAIARSEMRAARPLDLQSVPAAENQAGERISLCLITKNEAHNLPRLFASLENAVDEIVLVDTGSSDETVAIAEQWGARVLFFAWRDDFAAAKNFALEAATGDWILHLDADMAFPPGQGQRIRQAAASGAGQAYFILVRSPSADAYNSVETVAHPWLFRNLPGARFKGAVHEMIWPQMKAIGMKPVMTDICVDHFGYQEAASMYPRYERDVRILTKRLESGEDNTALRFSLGRAYAGLGRFDEALDQFRQVLTERTIGWRLRANTLRSIGGIHITRGDHPAATAIAEELQSLYPDDRPSLFAVGQIYRLAGQLPAAQRALEKALAAAPPAGAEGVVSEISNAQILTELGLVGSQAGNWEAAVRSYRQALQAGAGTSGVWMALGEAEYQLGNLEAARQAAHKALEFQAEQAAANRLAGLIEAQMGYPGPAVDWLEAGMRGGLADEEAWTALEEACAASGQAERPGRLLAELQASEHLSEATRFRLGLAPEQPETYADELAALARQRLEKGETAIAVTKLLQATQVAPGRPGLHNSLGLAWMMAGDLPHAAQAFAAELAINPQNDQVFNNLGALQWQAGDLNEAAACFKLAIRLNPGNAEARNNLARLEGQR